MSLARQYRSKRSKARRKTRVPHPADESQERAAVLHEKLYDWDDLDRELLGYANYLDDKVQQLEAVSSGGDWQDFSADICSGGEMAVILRALRLALSVIEKEPGATFGERRAMSLARKVLFTGSLVASHVEGFSPTAVLIALGFKALDFYLAQQKKVLDAEMHESLQVTRDTRKQVRKVKERLVRHIDHL